MYRKELNDNYQGEIIANRGYPVEYHYITTTDGYILEAQRIPYGKSSGPAPNKPVAFLQHGLLSSSADFIIGSTDTALGTYLLYRRSVK